jgi:CRISPR-associated exonuclease Cas4
MEEEFNEFKTLISPSLLMEYWYCPRFIYFMEVLKIRQYEEKRLKVLIGREIHEKKALQPDYLRKKIGVVKQEKNVYLSAPELGICGILDEILFLEDGSISLLDYKFAYNKHKFKTQFLQNVLYAMLIESNYHTTVDACYIVYTREKNDPIRYTITTKDKEKILDSIKKVNRIVQQGYYPPATPDRKKCGDCTYERICVS